MWCRLQIVQVTCDFQLRLQLRQRSQGNVEKSDVVCSRCAAMTFSNVTGNGHYTPSHLRGQSVDFFTRKIQRLPINLGHKRHALLPDKQITIRPYLGHAAPFTPLHLGPSEPHSMSTPHAAPPSPARAAGNRCGSARHGFRSVRAPTRSSAAPPAAYSGVPSRRLR